MNIGLIIRKLRVSKKMSQEELAVQLGVSPQAVSRWENGVTYPDISLLSSIALLFNVTIDYLLCGDENLINKQIDEAIEEADKVLKDSNHTDYLKPLEIVRELLAKYPNNERLIIETLHRITQYANEIEGYDYSAAIKLCERILNISKDDVYREEAKIIMLDCYVKVGLIEKAIEVMDSIPATLNRYQLKMRIFGEKTPEFKEANKKNTGHLLLQLIDSLLSEIQYNIDNSSEEELMSKLINLLKIYEGVYGDEWIDSKYSIDASHIYIKIIQKCIRVGNLEKAFEYFEKLVNYIISYDKKNPELYRKKYIKNLFKSNKFYLKLEEFNSDKYNELMKMLE